MRTSAEITADAADQRPFSNSTEYEIWANDRGCYDCTNDDDATEKWCPILSLAITGMWPKEWTRRTVDWEINGKTGSYETVGDCTEFDERRDDDGGPDDAPEPDPGPSPVIEGQIDMFEVFAERITDEVSTLPVEAATR